MGDVIPFSDDTCEPQGRAVDRDLGAERFLIDEGLELLAAYRSIRDATVRQSFKASIIAVARSMRPVEA